MSLEELQRAGVSPGTVRVSIGLERQKGFNRRFENKRLLSFCGVAFGKLPAPNPKTSKTRTAETPFILRG